MPKIDQFEQVQLDEDHAVFMGRLRNKLIPTDSEFETLWTLHPTERPTIKIHGKDVRIPRWQQAYGRDYRFSGTISSALPIPDQLKPYIEWAQETIDSRLNGMLLNWYDGALGHYIGKHRDSNKGIIANTPYVTISLGESRVFRFQKWRGMERLDLIGEHGSVIVIPYHVNKAWTHAVPKTTRAKARRVSITVRAFENEKVV